MTTEELTDKMNQFVEITLKESGDFLKVKETLTRMGIAVPKEKKLIQSCHILHKKGKYYIMHFKEMFILDGKKTDFTIDDVQRRNVIINLLEEWNLIKIVNPAKTVDEASLGLIKIISHKEKGDWKFESKYSVGQKR